MDDLSGDILLEQRILVTAAGLGRFVLSAVSSWAMSSVTLLSVECPPSKESSSMASEMVFWIDPSSFGEESSTVGWGSFTSYISHLIETDTQTVPEMITWTHFPQFSLCTQQFIKSGVWTKIDQTVYMHDRNFDYNTTLINSWVEIILPQ